MAKTKKTPPLESGLMSALKALDAQVAREMQRSPADREHAGVRKWEPYQKRIEIVTTFILGAIGEGEVQLDSLLISSQSLVKALRILIEDMEEQGLGKVRSEYCREAIKAIADDAHKAQSMLNDDEILM